MSKSNSNCLCCFIVKQKEILNLASDKKKYIFRIILSLIVQIFIDLIELEANIIWTGESSVSVQNGTRYPASKLIDGLSLDGQLYNEKGCALTNAGGALKTKWFSLELDASRTVTKVQIARRMDPNKKGHGNNVTITIGPAKEYDPDEPLCLPEIPDLVNETGLVDYSCTLGPAEGKYVKISSPVRLCICEAKVFVHSVRGKLLRTFLTMNSPVQLVLLVQ